MQSVSYMGDGTTTEFTFNFPYYENSNIVVTKNGATASGYNIIGTSGGLDADIPYVGGKVVFETAPSSLDNITIARHLPLTRTVDYQPTAKIEPTTLNQDMNYLMELLKDQSTDLINLHTQYTEIADKDSTATLLARITEIGNKITAVNQTITDFNTAIANGRIMSRDDFYSYATNCVTEIPQDIKLELSSGTLTLKAGSKAYMPNGAGVFDVVTTESDISITGFGSGTRQMLLMLRGNGTTLDSTSVTGVTSGTTAPENGMFYNTTMNNIDYYSSGTAQGRNYCLPLGVITFTDAVITSIDQVFNGFGYIGSTAFVLPSVKCLTPNGRNTNGTLKNIQTTVSSVTTLTVNGNTSIYLALKYDTGALAWWSAAVTKYNAQENMNYYNGVKQSYAVVGKYDVSSGQITNFKPNLVFSCVE